MNMQTTNVVDENECGLWLHAESLNWGFNLECAIRLGRWYSSWCDADGRCEFIGDEDEHTTYIGKDVTAFYGKSQNPVKYINMWYHIDLRFGLFWHNLIGVDFSAISVKNSCSK